MEVICSPPLVPPCTKQQEPPMAPYITVHLMAFPIPETTLGETANLAGSGLPRLPEWAADTVSFY